METERDSRRRAEAMGVLSHGAQRTGPWRHVAPRAWGGHGWELAKG